MIQYPRRQHRPDLLPKVITIAGGGPGAKIGRKVVAAIMLPGSYAWREIKSTRLSPFGSRHHCCSMTFHRHPRVPFNHISTGYGHCAYTSVAAFHGIVTQCAILC